MDSDTPDRRVSLARRLRVLPDLSCADWMALRGDLERLDDIVSLVLVADPFGNHKTAELAACFPDLHVAYKEHYVIDLARPVFERLSNHHARNVRKATRQVEVERCKDPIRFVGDWMRLYGALIERHQIQGIAAFSRTSFEKQMHVPGLILFRAVARNETVDMVLWYQHNEIGYYHLAAYSYLGYELKASFAVFASAIDYFSMRLRLLSLGAGAGIYGSEEDGLTRFKKSWATGTRTAYLCGRIFDRARYDELVRMPSCDRHRELFSSIPERRSTMMTNLNALLNEKRAGRRTLLALTPTRLKPFCSICRGIQTRQIRSTISSTATTPILLAGTDQIDPGYFPRYRSGELA
jgi:hypothetical protein